MPSVVRPLPSGASVVALPLAAALACAAACTSPVEPAATPAAAHSSSVRYGRGPAAPVVVPSCGAVEEVVCLDPVVPPTPTAVSPASGE